MQTPYQLHWDAACPILQYLKGAPGRGLFYRPFYRHVAGLL